MAHAETKKFPKKQSAHELFGSAVKWAEMAADHENGRTSKKNFSQAHGHYNCNQNKPDSSLLMKQNANFQAGITQV